MPPAPDHQHVRGNVFQPEPLHEPCRGRRKPGLIGRRAVVGWFRSLLLHVKRNRWTLDLAIAVMGFCSDWRRTWGSSLADGIAALGKTPEQMVQDRKKPGAFLPFIYAFVANISIAGMLAGVLAHLGAGQVTLRNGIISAAFLWFGFVLTTMVVNYSFSGRDRRLLLIDAGNWLLVLLVIGAIIGGIGGAGSAVGFWPGLPHRLRARDAC